MTEIAQTYLGNIDRNPDLGKLVAKEACLEVFLNQSDRAKGRIHTHTNNDLAVGIVKSRDRPLQSGDVFKTESNKFLIVYLREQELLVLDLSVLKSDVAYTKLVHLGHVLGNHHYPINIQNQKIYIQVTTEKEIIEKIIKDIQIPDLKITYEMQNSDSKITFSTHSH